MGEGAFGPSSSSEYDKQFGETETDKRGEYGDVEEEEEEEDSLRTEWSWRLLFGEREKEAAGQKKRQGEGSGSSTLCSKEESSARFMQIVG